MILRYVKEGTPLTLKLMSKIPAEHYFSFKKAEKVEKLVLLFKNNRQWCLIVTKFSWQSCWIEATFKWQQWC